MTDLQDSIRTRGLGIEKPHYFRCWNSWWRMSYDASICVWYTYPVLP